MFCLFVQTVSERWTKMTVDACITPEFSDGSMTVFDHIQVNLAMALWDWVTALG